MTDAGIKLRIAIPSELFLQGQGFYQKEEDSLYVQMEPVTPKSRFYSFLEAPQFRLDIDQAGRLLFLELNVARHTWPVAGNFSIPSSIGFADIRWLDFRRQIPPPILLSNFDRTSLLLAFGATLPERAFHLSKSVIIQTTSDNCLAAIIVTDIVDDLAGQAIAAFRQEIRFQGNAKDRPR